MEDLDDIEAYFNIKINVYRLNGNRASMERHSDKNFKNVLNLNIYSDDQNNLHHFSYIVNISQVIKVFQCPDCGTFIEELRNMKRHLNTCDKNKPKIIFDDGIYQPKLNVFDQLELNGITVEKDLKYYPYFIFYDFETWMKPTDELPKTKLTYIGSQELLSISLMGSEDDEPIFIPVENDNPKEALDIMINKMNEIRKKYLQQLHPKYSQIFKQISRLEDKKRKLLFGQLWKWLEVMPVYGYNSASYDINVVKRYLPQLLTKDAKKYGNISKAEKLWLKSIEEKLGRNIEHNKKIGNYNVDGYDSETNTVYEFNGCFFHGCPNCYEGNEKNTLTGDKMTELLERTLRKEATLKAKGYNIKSIWGCQFKVPDNIEYNDIIKCNNKYKMISNGSFMFKDIIAYLPPGTSFDGFLKTFDTHEAKGVFPHRVTQNLSKFKDEYELQKYTNVMDMLRSSKIPAEKWFIMI